MSEHALIEALQSAAPQVDGSEGLTLRELVAKTRWGDKRIRDRLRTLASQDRLVVDRRSVIGLSGGRFVVPIYRLKEPA